MGINWSQNLLFPIVAGIIVLLIEYLGIQPWLRIKEQKLPPYSTIKKDGKYNWREGIKNGIAQFKQHNNSFNWGIFSLKQNFISITYLNIEKGQARLSLTITERYILSRQRDVAEFEIIIDRLGDISYMESFPVTPREQGNKLPGISQTWIIVGVSILFFIVIVTKSTYENKYNANQGIPIEQLREESLYLPIGSPQNGSLGKDEVQSYYFSSGNNTKLLIEIEAFEDFRGIFRIYKNNDSLVTEKLITSSKWQSQSIEIAPEPNTVYLLVIETVYEGSYTLIIQSD